MSGLCVDATRRETDRRPGQGAQYYTRRGHPRRSLGPATQQALRYCRRDWRAHGVSRERAWRVNYRHGASRRWWMDRLLTGSTFRGNTTMDMAVKRRRTADRNAA